MNKNLKLILTAWMLAPGLVLAQSQTAPPANSPASSDVQQDKQEIQQTRQDIQKDRQEVGGDLKQMQALDAKHADAINDLNAKEKAAMDAVKDDKSLTPAQRKEKLAALRKDFNAQRKELNAKFRADKKSLQADMKKDRREIRRDRRELGAERRDLHRDVRHERQEHGRSR